MTRMAMVMHDQFIIANGVGLRVRIDGPTNAPALLLSNSLGTTLDMWAPQMPALTSRFRVIRYDSRGHGGSEVPEGDYTIEALGRDALGILDHLGIERAHFCGISKGGMVGQWLGTNAGERIVRLALANTAAYLGPPAGWDARILLVREKGLAALTDAVIERWFTPKFRMDHAAAVAPIRAMVLATPPVGYARCCAAIRDMDQRKPIAGISVPTLIIGGLEDLVTPPHCVEEIAATIPGARLVMLPAAHLSNVERPGEYTQAIVGFFEDKD